MRLFFFMASSKVIVRNIFIRRALNSCVPVAPSITMQAHRHRYTPAGADQSFPIVDTKENMQLVGSAPRYLVPLHLHLPSPESFPLLLHVCFSPRLGSLFY